MKNKKLLTIIGILVLLVTVVGLSYSFFVAQGGAPAVKNVNILVHTVDTLTFSVDDSIDFEVSQQNLTNGGNNVSGEATATALLSPNNNSGTATKSYYLYLYLDSNSTVYSSANTNEQPELMLQVFDESDQLVTISGLGNQKTVGSLTGYDITGVEGLITLLNNHSISASNETLETEDWRVVLTFVNLPFNQNENASSRINGKLVLTEEQMQIAYKYWNDNFSDNDFEPDEMPSGSGLSGVFDSHANLVTAISTAYNNSQVDYQFEDRPYYIKTTVLNNEIIGHKVCIYHNNNEFCIGPNYWKGVTCEEDTSCYSDAVGLATKNKLKTDIEHAFGITIYGSESEANEANSNYYCNYTNHSADCYLGGLYCYVSSSGHVDCGDESECCIDGDGDAYCDVQ